MNGITIINEQLCRVVSLEELMFFFISATFFCAVGMFLAISSCKELAAERKLLKFVLIVAMVVLIVIYAVLLVSMIQMHNEMHVEYTIVVEDGITFNDVCENYYVVFANGNEYRVVEK